MMKHAEHAENCPTLLKTHRPVISVKNTPFYGVLRRSTAFYGVVRRPRLVRCCVCWCVCAVFGYVVLVCLCSVVWFCVVVLCVWCVVGVLCSVGGVSVIFNRVRCKSAWFVAFHVIPGQTGSNRKELMELIMETL